MGKRATTIIGLVLFVIIIHAVDVVSASSTRWSKTYGEGTGKALVETSEGGFAVAAVTGNDFWLIKTDAHGNVEWNQTYGGPESETVKALVTTSDGGFAILGHFTDGYGNCDCLLVKTDAYGNMEWNQTFGRRSDLVNSLIETSDGGYAIAGSFSSDRDDPFGDRDFWLIKTDSYGNTEWTQTYGRLGYDGANALIETFDGGYLLAGNTGLYLVQSNILIIKTDQQGNMEWNQTYQRRELSGANSLVKTIDGSYAIGGYLSHDFWLIKIDQTGNPEWNQTYSKSKDAEAYSLVITSDGGYAIAGIVSSYVGQQADIDSWIVKTDGSGNMMWNQTYGGLKNQHLYSLVETSDKGFVLAGFQTSNHYGSAEVWLIKTDEFGVVPEFPSRVVLPLVLVLTLIVAAFRKKLYRTKTSQTY